MPPLPSLRKSPPTCGLVTILLSLGGIDAFDSHVTASQSESMESISRPEGELLGSPIRLPSVSSAAMDLTRARSKRPAPKSSAVTGCLPRDASTEDVVKDASPPKRMCLGSFRGLRKHFLDRYLNCSTERDDILTAEDVAGASPMEVYRAADNSEFRSIMERNSVGQHPSQETGLSENRSRVREIVLFHPEEKEWEIHSRYLVWAYDVFHHGWQHLVPFKITESMSVFGLADAALKWEAAREVNPVLERNFMLEAGSYRRPPDVPVMWGRVVFAEWLARTECDLIDVGFRQQTHEGSEGIPLSQVNAALDDVLGSWPAEKLSSTRFAANMACWWKRCREKYNGGVSLREFHGLVLKKFGTLRVPLDQVAKASRRNIRRQKIQERVAALAGIGNSDPGHTSLIQIIMSDSPPSHLVNISGNKFQIVAEGETDLRIQSRYLVWAYDILNHDWHGGVLTPVLSPELSVFGLAQKACEWEANHGPVYTSTASCYNCGEGNKAHPSSVTCERCEQPWSPEEFWEWLRSRHFQRIWDQLKNPRRPLLAESTQFVNNQDRLYKMIGEIGFDVPTGNKQCTFEMCHQAIERFLPTPAFRSLSGRFAYLTRRFKQSSNSFGGWEHERLVVQRVSSYCTNQVDPVSEQVCGKPDPTASSHDLAVSLVDRPIVGHTVGVFSTVESSTCTGSNESIPAFQVIFPQEDPSAVAPKYLVWAHNIFYWNWWHLVPFEVSEPVSVFGLARKAADWEAARRGLANRRGSSILEAKCYSTFHAPWSPAVFLFWLRMNRSADDVGCGTMDKRAGGWFIPLNQVDDALRDVLGTWPIDECRSHQFAKIMNCWRSRYSTQLKLSFSAGSDRAEFLSLQQFEGLVVKKLGDLRVPLSEVAKKIRRTQRRQRILDSVAELIGGKISDSNQDKFIQAIMSDSHPPHLMDISGNKFQVITPAHPVEAELRIQPRYLVWAYDSLRHCRVPQPMWSPGLSVFELAQKACAWEDNGGKIYILTASCYNCGEGSRVHGSTTSCERCEQRWSPEEFWEWLRSRHFLTVYDQLKNINQIKDSRQPRYPSHDLFYDSSTFDRRHWSRIIDEIGFDCPVQREGPTFKMMPAGIVQKFFPTDDDPSFGARYYRWWSNWIRHVGQHPDGFCRWELERLILHKVLRSSSEAGSNISLAA